MSTVSNLPKSFKVDKEFLDTFIKEYRKQHEERDTQKSAHKTYENLAYVSAMEIAHCRMLIKKLNATIKVFEAQLEYYETLSKIEKDNEAFGFDLSI